MAKRGNPAWQKGVSGNQTGRTPGSSGIKTKIQQAFLDMMATQVKAGNKTQTFFEAYNDAFLKDALDPKSPAFKFMAERLYGMDILADVDAQLNKSRREDTDFMTYRILKKGFDLQQKVLLSPSKDKGLMCGRRAGKTETNKLRSISVTQEARDKRVLIIGLTVTKTHQIYWDDILTMLDDLGISYTPHATDERIDFENGSFIQLGGNSNKVEREKYRGQYWDLIIIDEAQSQPDLGMFVQEIIRPMLLDKNGELMLTGSGPRTRGTYWEKFFTNPSPSGLRVNWNLSANPHIYNYELALQQELEKHGLKETDALWLREYLGLIAYDDDALVFRLNDNNYVTQADIDAWVSTQSPADIRFVAGLDYGFRDSDALSVIMYSEKSQEKFLVYQYKASGTDVTTLVDAIKASKEYIASRFPYVYNKEFDIWADTSDQKISLELTNRYGITVHPAIKYDKTLAIQMLQEEIRKGLFKVERDTQFAEESLRTIFKRIEQEGSPSIITREIDDEVYHPDLMDAILYSLRYYWLTHSNTPVEKKEEVKEIIYKPHYNQESQLY